MSERSIKKARIREYDSEIERLKLYRRLARQEYFRAGWAPTPNPYALDEYHSKLADRMERREYHIQSLPAGRERNRLLAIDDRENGIANLLWKRMAEKQKAGRLAA